MTERKFFGTDGIRGRVGEHPITADFVLRLGWAAGRVFGQGQGRGRKRILVGKDTRISGYLFESALQAGIIAAGVDVSLLGPMPTPAIAYLTRTFRAAAGIVISASHNPFDDNGIKFFGTDGRKLADAVEAEIEEYLDQDMATVVSERLGRASRIGDAAGRYIEFCKGTLPFGFHLGGLDVVVDCGNGATYHVAPDVLTELGAHVHPIGVEPDGLNINHECGSMHPARLQREVVNRGADLGVAFDGDGDRVIFVDATGDLLDGDELLYILATHRQASGGCNGVVGTLMSNYGLELALAELQVPFVRTAVGDRYVIEAMAENRWLLGGENSGHIICGDLTTTGDGLVAALQVLRVLAERECPLKELRRGMTKLPQTMVNVAISRGQTLGDCPKTAAAVMSAEERLAGRGRVLLRPSGTEPVVRVMVEGEDAELVRQLASELADVVASQAG
ncbi:MAG TPA: phosphoglucosamine mutase [Porticoccaceae bacterium]|nr:phosphoglucosamine mutase [Porticoccaceae bacterium]